MQQLTIFGEKGVPFVFQAVFGLRLRTEREIHRFEVVNLVKMAFCSYFWPYLGLDYEQKAKFTE
jgi:hypothetical protein